MVRWSPKALGAEKVTPVSLIDGREKTLCDAVCC